MAEQYPFVLGNGRLSSLIEAIGNAARPPRFSQEFLKTLGFGGSNDRAFVPLFRRLGFVEDNGAPNDSYDRLRDPRLKKQILAEKIRDLYADLFSINTSIQSASDDEIKGAISRVTGKDASTVQRYFATFKALVALADFSPGKGSSTAPPQAEEPKQSPTQSLAETQIKKSTEFHYNIQIHLPATSEVSVYNAIFRALKDNLDI